MRADLVRLEHGRTYADVLCAVPLGVGRIEAPDGWMTLHLGVHDEIQGNDQALTSDPWIGGCFRHSEVAPLEGT